MKTSSPFGPARSLGPTIASIAVCLAVSAGCSSPPMQPEHGPASTSAPLPPVTTTASTSAAVSSGTAAETNEPAPKASATSEEMATVAKGDTAFALALYAKAKEEPNTLISPASARIVLAMTFSGAKGATASQMAKTLAIPDDPKTHDAFGAILGQWQSWATSKEATSQGQPFTLRAVNRLFGQKGKVFQPAFLSLVSDKYGAPLEQLDFQAAADASRKHINQWVEDRTEKRIKDLLAPPHVTAGTRLVLVNALYFKADWQSPFEKSATQDADFFVTPQSKGRVPMMSRDGSFRYAETPDAQILEMPYRGAPVAMTIVLPRAKDGLGKIESALSPAGLDAWLTKLAPTTVRVHFPKFRVEWGKDLGPMLVALGMTDAFDGAKADFSGMTGTKELFIGAVVQKTFCEVDEKGTEAAAATAVVMAPGSAAPAAPAKDFLADHPFLFMIRDTKTGSLLFLGRFSKP